MMDWILLSFYSACRRGFWFVYEVQGDLFMYVFISLSYKCTIFSFTLKFRHE